MFQYSVSVQSTLWEITANEYLGYFESSIFRGIIFVLIRLNVVSSVDRLKFAGRSFGFAYNFPIFYRVLFLFGNLQDKNRVTDVRLEPKLRIFTSRLNREPPKCPKPLQISIIIIMISYKFLDGKYISLNFTCIVVPPSAHIA